MKSDLQVKFLSYMTGRKKGEGFTLIELLVVIIIIGILAAIALPSFLNQANKAKQSEAKQYVGALVRSEQAHYLENSKFASDIDSLSKVVQTETNNYKYAFVAAGAIDEGITIQGISQFPKALRSYAGGVVVTTVGGKGTTSNDATTAAVVCETNGPSATPPVPTPSAATGAQCGTGTAVGG
jgi:type IV pilus assembly protein PilA